MKLVIPYWGTLIPHTRLDLDVKEKFSETTQVSFAAFFLTNRANPRVPLSNSNLIIGETRKLNNITSTNLKSTKVRVNEANLRTHFIKIT